MARRKSSLTASTCSSRRSTISSLQSAPPAPPPLRAGRLMRIPPLYAPSAFVRACAFLCAGHSSPRKAEGTHCLPTYVTSDSQLRSTWSKKSATVTKRATRVRLPPLSFRVLSRPPPLSYPPLPPLPPLPLLYKQRSLTAMPALQRLHFPLPTALTALPPVTRIATLPCSHLTACAGPRDLVNHLNSTLRRLPPHVCPISRVPI